MLIDTLAVIDQDYRPRLFRLCTALSVATSAPSTVTRYRVTPEVLLYTILGHDFKPHAPDRLVGAWLERLHNDAPAVLTHPLIV